MSKQITLQIGLLAVLVCVAAALLWKQVLIDAPNTDDKLQAIDNDAPSGMDDAPAYDTVTQMYIDEGYPTAAELSPELGELMVNLFTQTDAFPVVDRMQFGTSDEWATIVSVPSGNGKPYYQCGRDGQPLCIMFYAHGDQVEVVDVMQSLRDSDEFAVVDAATAYFGNPRIQSILSMPFAGDVVIYNEFVGKGVTGRSWDLVETGAPKRSSVVSLFVEVTDAGWVGKKMTMMTKDQSLTFVVSNNPDVAKGSRVVVYDGEKDLLTVSNSTWESNVIIDNIVTPDVDSIISQSKLFFLIGAQEYVFEPEDGSVHIYTP